MKIAFFDAKPYDRPGFDAYTAGTGLEMKYFETKLNEDTVSLASGFDGVCVFVNDTLNDAVVRELHAFGVRVIALRCAGFNNVDIRACFGKIRVFRVPAYSPYAVAEHAMALLLTVNRHTNKAYIRTRDFNFSLSGLTGFDLHGKTVGIVGTDARFPRSARASVCGFWHMTNFHPLIMGYPMCRCWNCWRRRMWFRSTAR